MAALSVDVPRGTVAIDRVSAIPVRPTKILATGLMECGCGMAANPSGAGARLDGNSHYPGAGW